MLEGGDESPLPLNSGHLSKKFDSNGSGLLSLAEVQVMMEDLGLASIFSGRE